MPPLEPHNFALLQRVLETQFVLHLPPLLDVTKPLQEQSQKNLSRAFSAYALHDVCGIPPADAAKAVIDDFGDYGIDAIHYVASSETLYLVQSKLKTSEQFSQVDALAFCQGIRKIVKQELDTFNQNVQARKAEIEFAIENCSQIQLVVAYTGNGLSEHAKHAIDELLNDDDHGEERFNKSIDVYDSERVKRKLQGAKAYENINETLAIQKCMSVHEPRSTYFGLIKLDDLVKLHTKYGNALYAKNIRTFLGQKTDVNEAILRTLDSSPQDFLYLNNGVTALCQSIDPKGAKGTKRLQIRGLSVINGAQTIATSAQFVKNNAGNDISNALVSITLIRADSNDDFGKKVTRARNHQNPVQLANFAALDDEQERLRREIAYLDINYIYKASQPFVSNDPKTIRIEEAAQALTMLQADPRYVVWLKKEPGILLDTESVPYLSLFNANVTAFHLVNSVFLYRYIQDRIAHEVKAASGQERLVYKHGNYAIAWLLAKRLAGRITSSKLIDDTDLKRALSVPFDELRNTFWSKATEQVKALGPLAIFRNQTTTFTLLQAVMIEHYGLGTDPVVDYKQRTQPSNQLYPVDLFSYLVSKAPQIMSLA